MRHVEQEGELFLNGQPVGRISAQGHTGSWGFGQFHPADGFSQFAPLFGVWSLLIHEDIDRDRPSPEVLEELRAAEKAIDALSAEVIWKKSQQHMALSGLTIDGPLIEWRPK
jgi:hypothetical protein